MRYYIHTLALALGGGFLAAETRIFAPATASALSVALGIGIAITALGSAAFAKRGLSAGLGLAAAAVGAWTVVESFVFSNATVSWLSLGSGVAILGLSLIALVLHERSTERVVHELEVTGEQAVRDTVPAAA